jgi:CBS domain-containing protein
MGTVSHLLKSKGSKIISTTPAESVYGALETMVENNVSALLVMEGDRLVGIFTERDYARKVILKGKASRETTIQEIMTGNVVTVEPGTSIDHCMRLMTGNFFRHLPVVKDDQVLGIISIGDIMKYIIEEQEFIIRNMESYISQ